MPRWFIVVWFSSRSGWGLCGGESWLTEGSLLPPWEGSSTAELTGPAFGWGHFVCRLPCRFGGGVPCRHLRRVLFWRRTNAGGVLNTCKSNGDDGSCSV